MNEMNGEIKMKKIVAIVMSVLLLLGCLAGCGKGNDPNKQVTLTWVMGESEQKETARVLEKANEMLKTLLPNTKLDFVLDSSMASKWSLWMAGGKKYDIAHAGFHTDIMTEINNGAYMPLNDLIKEYAPTIQELSSGDFKDLFDYGTYNGQLYAIPCLQTYPKESLLVSIPAALRQYMNVEKLLDVAYASSTTTRDFYVVLDEYLQSAKKAKAIGNDKISNYLNPELTYKIAQRGYDFIGGVNSSIAYKLDPEKVEIVDFHKTEEFKEYLKWISKWYAEGFVSKDVLTGGTSGSKMYLIETHLESRKDEQADHTRTSYANDYAQDRCSIFVTNPKYDYKGAAVLGKLQTFLSVPTSSQAPERAMQFLELIYSEKGKELINLLTFGFEGEQYEKVSDQAIKAFEYEAQATPNVSYGIAPWEMGNMFNLYAVYPYDASTVEYAKNYWAKTNKERPLAAIYGFSFDIGKQTAILSDMAVVNQEYELQLTAGVYADYTELYNNMNSLNEKAGINDLIKILQKQADDYLAKK